MPPVPVFAWEEGRRGISGISMQLCVREGWKDEKVCMQLIAGAAIALVISVEADIEAISVI